MEENFWEIERGCLDLPAHFHEDLSLAAAVPESPEGEGQRAPLTGSGAYSSTRPLYQQCHGREFRSTLQSAVGPVNVNRS